MITQSGTRIIVACDAPYCTMAGRYQSYMEAGLSYGWHFGAERKGDDKQDYCDACWEDKLEAMSPTHVSINRADATIVLNLLRYTDDDDGTDDELRPNLTRMISYLEAALEK